MADIFPPGPTYGDLVSRSTVPYDPSAPYKQGQAGLQSVLGMYAEQKSKQDAIDNQREYEQTLLNKPLTPEQRRLMDGFYGVAGIGGHPGVAPQQPMPQTQSLGALAAGDSSAPPSLQAGPSANPADYAGSAGPGADQAGVPLHQILMDHPDMSPEEAALIVKGHLPPRTPDGTGGGLAAVSGVPNVGRAQLAGVTRGAVAQAIPQQQAQYAAAQTASAPPAYQPTNRDLQTAIAFAAPLTRASIEANQETNKNSRATNQIHQRELDREAANQRNADRIAGRARDLGGPLGFKYAQLNQQMDEFNALMQFRQSNAFMNLDEKAKQAIADRAQKAKGQAMQLQGDIIKADAGMGDDAALKEAMNSNYRLLGATNEAVRSSSEAADAPIQPPAPIQVKPRDKKKAPEPQVATHYRYTADRKQRIPVYADNTQGPVETAPAGVKW